jgi:hypothetical protein
MNIKPAYENRCHILNCPAASWKTILDMAFAQTGNDFRIDYINAHPSEWNNYTEAGPDFIEINVSYISLNTDKSSPKEEINHPMKFFRFNDQSLITDTSTGNAWSGRVPSKDSQEKLKRTIVTPRDVFRITWTLAYNESSLSAQNVNAFLLFDNINEEYGCESIWKVFYDYDEYMLVYYINAQTAQIIAHEKTRTKK